MPGKTSKRVLLVLLLLATTFAVGFTYYITQQTVVIIADEQVQTVNTFKDTVGEVLREANIKLQNADKVEPGLSAPVTDGMKIMVTRAFPVTVTADGREHRVITTPVTVAEVLYKVGVFLNEEDVVKPGLDKVVEPDETVQVVRVTTEEVEEFQEVPFKVVRKEDHSLARGLRRIIQRGKPGKEKVVMRIRYENGKEVSREIVDREIVEQPREQVVAMGTLQTYSRGSREFRFQRAIEVVATGYTHTGNVTYTGVYPKVGTVAVDPSVIPLGSRLYIEGYGFGVAQDTGGFIKGKRIDLFFENRQEALNWGRRKVKVYILQ